MIVYFLIVAIFVTAALVSLVRSMQRLKQLGWFTRRTLWWWNGIIAGLASAYIAYVVVEGRPLQVTGPAVALGLIVGTILLATMKPKWRANQ